MSEGLAEVAANAGQTLEKPGRVLLPFSKSSELFTEALVVRVDDSSDVVVVLPNRLAVLVCRQVGLYRGP